MKGFLVTEVTDDLRHQAQLELDLQHGEVLSAREMNALTGAIQVAAADLPVGEPVTLDQFAHFLEWRAGDNPVAQEAIQVIHARAEDEWQSS